MFANHFTRDMTKTGKVKLKFVPTKEMIADIMTKPLQGKVLETGRAQLGIVRVGDVGIWSPRNGRTSTDADGDCSDGTRKSGRFQKCQISRDVVYWT
jgi:hypothetical protein